MGGGGTRSQVREAFTWFALRQHPTPHVANPHFLTLKSILFWSKHKRHPHKAPGHAARKEHVRVRTSDARMPLVSRQTPNSPHNVCKVLHRSSSTQEPLGSEGRGRCGAKPAHHQYNMLSIRSLLNYLYLLFPQSKNCRYSVLLLRDLLQDPLAGLPPGLLGLVAATGHLLEGLKLLLCVCVCVCVCVCACEIKRCPCIPWQRRRPCPPTS